MIRDIARVAVRVPPMWSLPDPTPTVRSVMTVALIVASLLLAAVASAQSYDVSEEKQKLIAGLNKRICQIASDNNFNRIKRMLEQIGKRYLGEAITLEEAYPYIRCDKANARNIDLFRIAVEYPHLKVFVVNFMFHFVEEVEDETLLGKIVGCRRDFGHGCLDVLEHIERNRRRSSEFDSMVKRYDFLESALWRHMEHGHIRDPKFCRELLDESPHCQAREKSPEAVAATKAVLALRKQRSEAESRLKDVRRPEYAKGAAFAEVFLGKPSSYFGVLPTDIVSYCKRRLGLSPGTCEDKHKKFLNRVTAIYMGRERLISEAEAEFKRLETRLREQCRNVPEGTHRFPEGTHGCGEFARE